jgi:hypothetical protein
MWVKTIGLVAAVLMISLGGALAYGVRRWGATTDAFIARLKASRLALPSLRYDEREIEGLPGPVARYFRRVLRNGQPIVGSVRLSQDGKFRMGDAEDSWRPFAATQNFSPRPPAFVWDARIRFAPSLCIHVRDTYLAGAGKMRAELLGLVPILDVHDTPEIAAGALHRYLAEAVWFPTALLPSHGVQWAAIDDSTARATLADGATTVSLEFRFNAEGEIISAYTTSRYREVRGAYESTPWECHYGTYADRGGMRIPLEGEVEWHVPNRRLPYWRGRITGITYEYAQ